jgi:glutathione S-transferase
MGPKVRLFLHPISHYCVSAERMLAFKQIPFEATLVTYHDRQELLRVSGQDYIPTLVWGKKVVTWKEIPAFLDEVAPEPQLLPPGRAALAATLENWGHQVVEERVWRAVVTEMLPQLSTEVERWVFEEMQTRSRGPWEVLRHRKKEFVRDLSEYFRLIDGMLEGRDWLLDRPTVADFGVYGALSPWWTAGHPTPRRFVRLRDWAGRIDRLGPAPFGTRSK